MCSTNFVKNIRNIKGLIFLYDLIFLVCGKGIGEDSCGAVLILDRK